MKRTFLCIIAGIAVLLLISSSPIYRHSVTHGPVAPSENQSSETISNAEYRTPAPRFPSVQEESPLTAASSLTAADEQLINEDIEKMDILTGLSSSQKVQILAAMRQARTEPIEIGGETKAIKQILTDKQYDKWRHFQEEQQIQGAEDYANRKISTLSRITLTLSKDQKDALFKELTQSILNEYRSEHDILISLLTPEQLARWTNSDEGMTHQIQDHP